MTIIFDLDGTLLDTLDDLANAANFALKNNKLSELDVDAYKLMVGNGVKLTAERATAKSWLLWSDDERAMYMELAKSAADEHVSYTEEIELVRFTEAYQDEREAMVPRQLLDSVYSDFMEYYAQHSTDETKPYDGIEALLDSLKAAGHQTAVLSNKADPLTQAVATFYFKPGIFTAVVGMRDDVPAKPNPIGALKLAEMMSANPADIYYVGDTMTDMKTAVSAGMKAVGVTWGFRSKQELLDHGAKWIINEPLELLNLIN